MIALGVWLLFVIVMGRLVWKDLQRIQRNYDQEIEAQNKRIQEAHRE